MKLLEAEPTAAPPVPADAPADAAPAPDAAVRTCAACSAPMDPAQDWCLECGTAAPGRLGARPGWRAASTVVGLTLLLVLGAVAASYAALTGDATQIASRPAAPSAAPVAQAPPAVPPAEAPAPTPETPPAEDVPEVDAPPASSSDATDPVDVSPPASSPSTTPGTGSSTGPSGTQDGSDDETAPAGPAALALDADAGSVYDPYGKVAEADAPSRALDGKDGTSWTARAADDAESLGFGYVLELDDPADVRELVLQTKTPGFRVEVYGTTSKALPPDVLDQRWIHLRDRSDVDATVGGPPRDGNRSGDGEERITLGDNAEGKRLRHVLLWFTLIPENGPTIRLTELELRA